MGDMVLLLETTLRGFEGKIEAERQKVASSYNRILEKQKNMILAFEMKYTNLIKQRMDRIEAFTNDIAMEQARLAACAGMLTIDSKVPLAPLAPS